MDHPHRGLNRFAALWAPVAAGCVLWLGYLAWLVAGEPGSLRWVAHFPVYNGALLMGAIACLARAALVRRNRGPWALFGVGLLAWTAGDVYWYAVFDGAKHIPYPSWADAGYLAAAPCFFIGVALIGYRRISTASRTVWFDGAIAAVAAASASVALLGPALVGATNGQTSVVLTNLAYPLGDVFVIALIAALLGVSGLRGAKPLFYIGAGILAWTFADGIYLWATARGVLTSDYLDLAWPAGALAIAFGALVSVRSPITLKREYRPGLFIPLLSTLVAVVVLVWDHFSPAQEISVWLGAGTLLLVAVRLALSFRENDRLVGRLNELVDTLQDESITDHLTDLGNRRALMNDLGALLADTDAAVSEHVFMLFDLDGFKSYNDTFGHPAGDALLSRLAANLKLSIDPIGTPYRLGGDEFCVLVELRGRKPVGLVELARSALTEHGKGFAIGASAGMVRVPAEAWTPSEVLRLADQRLYAEKANRSTRTGDQTRDLLLSLVHQRDPALGLHVDGVAILAVELGRRMDLDAEDLDVLRRAAELHDVGKIAIPEDIIQKNGPLTAVDWHLMRQHTIIGERLLSATEALTPVAAVVRSSHERWDGCGYPDALAGEAIPLLSRIVFVCDAYEAMRAKRPYKVPMSQDEVAAELRRNSGTQFDPQVVELFCDEVLPAGARLLKQGSERRSHRGQRATRSRA